MKILFASIPFDGHVNPLTGLAQYLVASGHDVRWYTQSIYAEKLGRLGVHHYPFKRALQYNQYNLDTILAERLTYRKQVDRLNFDLQHVFIKRAPEFFEDIKDIHDEFPFDVFVADVMFTALPLVKIGMRKPVIAVGVLPLVESSCDLAPAGLGMMPAASWGGKVKQRFLRFLTDRVLFGKSHELYRDILKQYGIVAAGNTMDFLVKTATYFLQSGTPGFEYNRSDLGKNIRFIGPLLPASRPDSQTHNLAAKAARFGKVILVTQGTIEKDPEKLIVPALEAFKGSRYLVVVTTGGSKTNELRARYTHENVIIEDFIPFESILPYTSVFVTNGGYGGVMLSIRYNVPLVVAGIHEGKNEINARVQYFQLGINLDTETPSARQIHRGVTEILEDPLYRLNVRKLGQEFRKYDPLPLCERYIQESVTADEVLDRDLIIDGGESREQARYNDVLMP